MSVVIERVLLEKFEELFSNKYAKVFADNEKKVLVCQTQATYIPIEAFKETFLGCSELVAQHQVKKFVFDKRSLRAFHQPSMEWYIVKWKQALFLEHGLRMHRKILPDQPWFIKCVEAGWHEIKAKHSDNVFSSLDIRYTSSIEESLQV